MRSAGGSIIPTGSRTQKEGDLPRVTETENGSSGIGSPGPSWPLGSQSWIRPPTAASVPGEGSPGPHLPEISLLWGQNWSQSKGSTSGKQDSPALSLSVVAWLQQLLTLFRPQFPHLQNGADKGTCLPELLVFGCWHLVLASHSHRPLT